MSGPAPELLSAAQQGDKAAEERLLTENSRLIWSVVRRYLGRGVEQEDLYQLGCIGFLKAIQGYDPAFGTQFSTYAVPKIAGEMRRFLRDDGTVKVSRTLRERAARIAQARTELTHALGYEPTVSELAEYLELDIEDIAMAETATSAVASRYPPSCRVSSPLLPAASRFFIHPSSHSRPSRTVTGLKPSPESASKIRMGTGMARNISLSRIRAGSFAGSSNASIRPFSMTITRSA